MRIIVLFLFFVFFCVPKNTSAEDIKEAELKFVNNKLQGYEDTKIAWKLQTVPTGIVAFILCSSPGKKLTVNNDQMPSARKK